MGIVWKEYGASNETPRLEKAAFENIVHLLQVGFLEIVPFLEEIRDRETRK